MSASSSYDIQVGGTKKKRGRRRKQAKVNPYELTEEMEERQTTITVKLQKCCNSHEIVEEINSIAKGITRMRVYASRLVQIYILNLLESDQEIPELTNTHFRQAMSMFSRRGSSEEGRIRYLSSYQLLRLDLNQIDLFDMSYLSVLTDAIGDQYHTNSILNIALNLKSRFLKSVSYFLKNQPAIVPKNRTVLINFISNSLKNQATLSNVDALWARLKVPVNTTTKIWILEVFEQHLSLVRGICKDLNDVNQVKNVWWKFIPATWRFLTNIQGSRVKHFSILPICTNEINSIPINIETLGGIVRRICEKGIQMTWPIESKSQFIRLLNNRREFFHHYFNVNIYERHNLFFDDFFYSNGYSCSLLMKKILTIQQPNILPTSLTIDSKKVIGIDPGVNSLVTCVCKSESIQFDCCYSGKEFYNKTGGARASKKRIKLLQNANLYDLVTCTLSPRTSSLVEFRWHCEWLGEQLDDVLTLNSQNVVKGLKFSQKMHSRKVLNEICDRILECGPFVQNLNNVCIAFGDARFTNYTGFTGPSVSIRRQLVARGVDVFLVNEDYTSQLCFKCLRKLSHALDQFGDSIYSVFVCENESCPITFINRDINAALNIRNIFRHQCLYSERPEEFTRAFQSSEGGSGN